MSALRSVVVALALVAGACTDGLAVVTFLTRRVSTVATTVAATDIPSMDTPASAVSHELDSGNDAEQGPTFHALNWKKEVKAFSSADLKANMAAAMGGKDVLNGAGDSLRTVSAPVAAAAPKPPTMPVPITPKTPDAEAGIKVRSWLEDEPQDKDGWTVDRLKDALAATEQQPARNRVKAPRAPAAPTEPPVNLIDLDDAPSEPVHRPAPPRAHTRPSPRERLRSTRPLRGRNRRTTSGSHAPRMPT